MRTPKKFYIKERFNPQLGTYYVACGQLSALAARKMEGSIYGSSLMHAFDTEEAYRARLEELKNKGEHIQWSKPD